MSRNLIPLFLTENFDFDEFDTVEISRLYVGLLPSSGGKAEYYSIRQTPHYVYARHILNKKKITHTNGYESYEQYVSANHPSKSVDRFSKLCMEIVSNGYDWRNRPIFVFRNYSRPFPFDRWDVADGFHRLAILAALGEERLIVAKLRSKYTVVERFIRRLKRMGFGCSRG